MTKNKAIETVENSFPSIWSREDVLSLLNQIDEGTAEFDKDKLIKKIRNAVDSAINGMRQDDMVDMDNCEFNIRNGNEIEIDSYTINTEDIIDAVMDDVTEAVNEYEEEAVEQK